MDICVLQGGIATCVYHDSPSAIAAPGRTYLKKRVAIDTLSLVQASFGYVGCDAGIH